MALNALSSWVPLQMAEKAVRWLWTKNRPVTFAVVAVVGAIKIRQHLKEVEKRKKWNSAGKDVVVLHIFTRGYYCTSLSPFVVKLETFLRIADIPYVVDYEQPLGPKGKAPWITLNGQDMSDSQLIMDYLGPKYKKDLNGHLTEEEKAIAHSMQIMLDEYLLWCFLVWLYDQENGKPQLDGMKNPLLMYMVMPMLSKRIVKESKGQGIGRHSHQEVVEIGRKCLKSLSSWLGKKPFFMGDKPSEADCSVFGMLSQILWAYPNNPYQKMLANEFKNLSDYAYRVKDKFYPDWEKCLEKSG